MTSTNSAKGMTNTDVAAVLRNYVSLFDESIGGDLETRKQAYQLVVNHYYDLVTDFYQFGWGDAFHFAPRHQAESLKASLARCERFFATELQLKPGSSVLDIGCGVGGPLCEIAQFSGANVTGINNNAYQVSKVKQKLARFGLDRQCSVIKGDFMKIPRDANTFDAAYTLEATPHAPDKIGVYREIYRVLKPGGLFVGDEWCVTESYNPENKNHVCLKSGIEVGNALPELATINEVVQSLKTVGFEIITTRDVAADSDPDMPWYRALLGLDLNLMSIPRTRVGRKLTNMVTRIFESIGVLPQGTNAISTLLNHAADDLVAAGIAGIFTPLFYFKVRKPE